MFGNPRVIDHPFVATAARELWDQQDFLRFIKDHPDRVRKAAVVGLLLEFFFSPKATDGDFVHGLTEQQIDRTAGVPGFGRALGLTGLLTKESYPREGMHAHSLETWFDQRSAEVMRALSAWWQERAAPEETTGDAEAKEEAGSVKVAKKDANAMFDLFWAAYPEGSRKVDKPGCRDKYAIILRRGVSHEAIMGGLGRWLQSQDWAKEFGKYVPQPMTWLNQSRWEAQPEPAATQKGETEASLSDEEVRRRRQETNDRIARKRGADVNGHSDHGG